MSTGILILAVAFSSVGQTSADQSPASSYGQCVDSLLSSRKGITSEGLRQSIDGLQRTCDRNDANLWASLRPILIDSSFHPKVRLKVLSLCCDKSGPAFVGDLLSILDEWVIQLSQGPSAEGEALHDRDAKRLLLGRVIGSHVPSLRQAVGDDRSLLDFLTLYAKLAKGGQYFSLACNAIASDPSPVSVRRGYALDIITAFPENARPHRELVRLLDASSFPYLRALVRSSDDPFSFHFSAASALAELGDTEIRPFLQTMEPQFRASGSSFGSSLRLYVRQIALQNPPSGLTDYIRSAEHVGIGGLREWAINRALSIGIPHDQIREAVLAHATHLTAADLDQNRARLARLKAIGVRHGILTASDFPDVNVSVAQPAPLSVGGNVTTPGAKPARQPWHRKPWKPNEANYEPLMEWWGTINWDTIDPVEGLRLLTAKMCELDLLSPEECEKSQTDT